MKRDTALKKALNYFEIEADEEGDLNLLYYVVDENNYGDDISLIGYANSLSLEGMFDNSISDFRERMFNALEKRHKRDVVIFKQLFSMEEEWAYMVLWNSIRNAQDHLSSCNKDEFTDEEWDYLEQHKAIEESWYDNYGLEFASEKGDTLVLETKNNFHYPLKELYPIARYLGASSPEEEHSLSAKIFLNWLQEQSCIIVQDKNYRSYNIVVKDKKSNEHYSLLNLYHNQEFGTLQIAVCLAKVLDSRSIAGILETIIDKLKRGKVFLMQDDPNWNYKYKRRKARVGIIRMVISSEDQTMQEALELAGFKRQGRLNKAVLDIISGEMKDGLYYEYMLNSSTV